MNNKQLLKTLHVFVLIFILSSCGNKEKPKEEPDTIGVTTLKLDSLGSQAVGQLSYNGTIDADKTVDLSFQVSGTITALPVQTGQYVKKGQLIAAVDETVYRNQYNAQLAQAKLAEENYNRTLEVYKKGSIAEIKMLQTRYDFEQAASAAKATYQNIVHTKLYAPENGYVGDKKAEVGATASPGMPIVQLLDIRSAQVLVAVPENEINKYKAGDQATVTVDALGSKPLTGKVTEIGVLALENSANYNVKVTLNNANNALKPGMLCNVIFQHKYSSLNTDSTKEVVVPVQTVQVDEAGKNYVFVVDETGKKAVRKEVQTGALYSSGIVIRQGLMGNEQLITSGYQKLENNTPVTVIQ